MGTDADWAEEVDGQYTETTGRAERTKYRVRDCFILRGILHGLE